MQTTKNILLTDDDTDDCMLFSEVFGEIFPANEARLTIANDGVELMEVLEETVPPPPEVIFLDLNMPRKNGFECLEEIRRSPKLRSIPVVILSTTSNRDVIEKTYRNGANYYVCKPQSYALLKKAVEQVLSLSQEQLNNQPQIEKFVIEVT